MMFKNIRKEKSEDYHTQIDSFEFNKVLFLLVVITVYVTGFLAYFLFMQTGYGNADAVVEGQWFYHNSFWHLSLGRWGVRYLNEWIGNNLVLPHIIVFIYCSIVIFVSLSLKQIFEIESLVAVVLSSVVLIVNPCVISQLQYRHVALSMAFSLLFSVLFVLCELSSKIFINLGGILCTAIMLGLYQSYVSVIAVLVLECIIIKLIKNDDSWKVKEAISFFFKSVITGVLGCGLYFLVLKFEMKKWNVTPSERLDFSAILSGGVKETIRHFLSAYKQFFYYYNDIMLNRYIYFRILFLIVVFSIFVIFISLIKNRKWGTLICVCISGVMIPIASYIIVILLNGTKMSGCMGYQYVLIIPFSFAMIEMGINSLYILIQEEKKTLYSRALKGISYVAVLLIAFSYIINANATWRSYELSYNATNLQYQMMLDRVYRLEGYEWNETPILPIGIISDRAVRLVNSEIYHNALDFPEYVYSWGGYQSVKDGRYHYLTGFFGIDPGFDPDSTMKESYEKIINSKEFKNMPLWPAEESVAMIEGIAVVKITDNPPI